MSRGMTLGSQHRSAPPNALTMKVQSYISISL
jgi:hypothetical protein